MSKILGNKFHLAWDAPTDKDVVGYVVYFADNPGALNYDAVSVEVAGTEFTFPDMWPPGTVPPSNGSQTFVAVAAKDPAGNLSDLVTITVPFDETPPGPVTNLRLV